MSEINRPITEVAAGILLDAEGRYLLGQRPEGKPYAGYWEIPGGKIEKGETVFEALKRELQEELGIEIQSSEELTVLEQITHTLMFAYMSALFVIGMAYPRVVKINLYHRNCSPQKRLV